MANTRRMRIDFVKMGGKVMKASLSAGEKEG
jgi:hypothetical protein